ncbi:hypothetical protein L798_11373 [Zootermopsis nevadensis]|uniref:Uncharacterized protein n=1 Tax=Zootermopsis nevadensis TaxID=136037 RepID=A0A067RSK2_ZOONE|nr:hypothetical protein L798_11373 [Zootermopsis nevadensis]
MDIYNLDDFTPLPRKYNIDEDVIKIWEERFSRKVKEAKSFTKRLEYELAIMNVKYPFLEISQCRGRALAKMNIPSFMGQIPTLRTLYQLATPQSKANVIQTASTLYPKRNKAKQGLKSRSKDDKTTKTNRAKVQIYEDPTVSNEDCDQSQKSQNHYSELHICKDIQTIPSNIGRLITSNFCTSLVTEIKQKEISIDIHKRNRQYIIKKRNRQNITKKRNRVKKQISKAIRSTGDRKEKRNMDTKGKENIEVECCVVKTKIFCTSKHRANNYQENKLVKDSETEEKEEDIHMSEVNTERTYIQQQWQAKNNNSTLGADLLSSTREANKAHNGDNAYSSDYTSSAPSSPLLFTDESILQTNNGSNVLPQYSPVHYVSLCTYSSSQESHSDTEDSKTVSGGEEVYSESPHTLQKNDTFLPSMFNPLSMKEDDIVRSISYRKLYNTLGSGSEKCATATTQITDDNFLADDHGTPAGNTNSSSDADFLADMFDKTAQVYHHHLRAVANPDLLIVNCKTALDI